MDRNDEELVVGNTEYEVSDFGADSVPAPDENFPSVSSNLGGYNRTNSNPATLGNLARGISGLNNLDQDKKKKLPDASKKGDQNQTKGQSSNQSQFPGIPKNKNDNKSSKVKPSSLPDSQGGNKNKLDKKMPPAPGVRGKALSMLSSLRSKRKGGQASTDAEATNEGQQSGIENLISIIPVGNPIVRVVLLVAGPAIPIILFILAVTIIAALIPTFTKNSDMCSTSSGVTFVGTADEKEFLCKMQSPYGNRSYPIFGWVGEDRGDHTHTGVDLSLSCGTPIFAAQGGVVESAGTEGGYGNSVVIKHGNGEFYTRYGHMSSFNVSSGQTVSKGQKIGVTGNTGNSGGCHLHFEVRKSSTFGDAVSAINNYFNASSSNLYTRIGRNMNVSDEFKQNCGSMWQGDPIGESIGSDDSLVSGGYSGSSNFSTSGSQCCVSTTPTTGTGGYCPNGITVEGSGTLDINDYIAGVVTAENSYEENGNIEASKANAVAARTYAINRTNNCQDKIGNSQAAQVYKEPGDIGRRASSETAGQVMLYNGNVFSSEYDSFCGSSGTATYTKVPSDITQVLNLNSKFSGKIAGGHCRGMSQLYARQLQDEGKTYEEILRFFYADGIEITGAASTNSCYVTQNSYTGGIVRYYQIDYDDPYGTFGTIKTHGCGPTAMAVVVSSLSGSNHDPIELTNYACSNDFCTDNGTKNTFFAAAAKKYGLNVKQISANDKDEVLIALNRGDSLVIALVGRGQLFTNSGGHFIVLTGSNGEEVSVHDPASRENSNKTYNFESQIVKETSDFWIISK